MKLDFAEVLVDGERPAQRGGHSAVTAEGQIVIFGGSSYVKQGEFCYYNDTFVLDTTKRVWHKVKCTGSLPCPRYGHSVELVGSRMFMFGGRSETGPLGDMYFLDLVEWTWVPVAVTSASPSPRFFHASLLVGRKIVIHGGWDGKVKCFDDFWVFNTDAFSWLTPKCTGLVPSPRYGHSLDLIHDGHILCFGGTSMSLEDPVPTYYNDLRSLDTETMIWAKLTPSGRPPSARFGFMSAKLDDEIGIAFFGGWGSGGLQQSDNSNASKHSFFVLRLDNEDSDDDVLSWVKPIMPPAVLAHKYGHTMTAVGPTLYVFGGWNGKQAWNSLTEIAVLPDEINPVRREA